MMTARELVRHVSGIERTFDGVAGVRDADAPCNDFVPGKPAGTDCATEHDTFDLFKEQRP